MDLDQILENLYVGSYPATEDDFQCLQRHAITAVLNVQSDEDFRIYGIDWPRWLARYHSPRIEVRRVPIMDFDDSDLRDKLPLAVEVLRQLHDLQHHCVLVHCNAGVNRSPSVVIGYLHWQLGWSLDRAHRHVTSCHRCAPVMEAIRLAQWDRRRMSGDG